MNFTPEIEHGLIARARELGVTIDEYLQQIVAEAVQLSPPTPLPTRPYQNLSDLLLQSPFAGSNLNLERSVDFPRSVEVE